MSKWIPVSEVMPEPGAHVDVWVGYNDGFRIPDMKVIKTQYGIKFRHIVREFEIGSIAITHWKPVMEPPPVKKKDEEVIQAARLVDAMLWPQKEVD